MWRSSEKCVVEGMKRSDMHVGVCCFICIGHQPWTDRPNNLTPAVHVHMGYGFSKVMATGSCKNFSVNFHTCAKFSIHFEHEIFAHALKLTLILSIRI